MPGLQEIRQNPKGFQALSPEAKRLVVDRLAAEDQEFQRLSSDAQAVVRQRLVGPEPSKPSPVANFLEPTLRTGQRVAERLRESGEAVLNLPGVTYKWLTGQAEGGLKEVISGEAKAVTLKDVGLTFLRAIGAPFEPIFAPIGESIRTAAEAVVSPETARTVGAVGEMAAGVGLPFVRVPATPVTRGLSKVGIGRLPEEAVTAERATAAANLPAAGREIEAAAASERAALLAAEEAAKPGPRTTMEASRRFQELTTQGQELAERIRAIEQAGQPVPKMLRREYEAIKEAMRQPVTAEVLRDVQTGEVLGKTADAVKAVPTVETLRSPRPSPTGSTPAGGPLTEPILREPLSRQVTQAAEQVFTKSGIPRDPARLLSDQLTDLLNQGKIPLGEFEATLRENGLSMTEFASQLFRPGVADAGRRLQALSVLARTIKQAGIELPEMAPELDEMVRGLAWWRRLDNIRRGLLVSQPATAIRNAISQFGRIGLDGMQSVLDASLQRLFTPGKVSSHPADGMELLLNTFRKGTKADVEAILKAFPAEHDRLFGTYASDIAKAASKEGVALSGADKAFTAAEQGVDMLNVLNRFQEFTIRRAVFQTKLAQGLRQQGKDLLQLIQDGRVAEIPEDLIKSSVQTALEMTWAKSPEFGTLGQKFISFVNGLPTATLAIPFPRFLVNSLKFFTDFSPFGMLKLLSSAERSALAAGNTEVLSRAILGTAMLGAAWEIRNSEYAGEKWYEVRVGDNTVDLRPFNPFAGYLFAADVIKRQQEGTLAHLAAKDILQGVLSANVRAGTGLAIIDKLLSGFTTTGSAEQFLRSAKELAGETAAGFLTPLQTLQDVLAEFDANRQIVREKRIEPFLGPIKAKIPGVSETLPEAEIPTREGPLRRQAPLLRQTTGLILTDPKNPLERELDRLQFTRQEILPATGEPEADRLIAKHMGRMAEAGLVPVMSRPEYQRLSDPAKAVVLQKLLSEVRTAARRQAEGENPDLFVKLKYRQAVGPRERGLVERRGPLLYERRGPLLAPAEP